MPRPLNKYPSADAVDLDALSASLADVNRQLADLEQRQTRVLRGMSREVGAANRDVERLNRSIENGAADALSGLLTDTRKTRQALESIWEGFLTFFSRRVVAGLAGALAGVLPSPGGLFGSLLGGLLGLVGLQEGGLVRGSRAGTPVVVGEDFTDELIVPLKKLGLSAFDVGRTGPAAAAAGAEVNVYPQFVIENRTPLEADLAIYRLAERGRARVAARALSPLPSTGREE